MREMQFHIDCQSRYSRAEYNEIKRNTEITEFLFDWQCPDCQPTAWGSELILSDIGQTYQMESTRVDDGPRFSFASE